jgi:hypothetical protein
MDKWVWSSRFREVFAESVCLASTTQPAEILQLTNSYPRLDNSPMSIYRPGPDPFPYSPPQPPAVEPPRKRGKAWIAVVASAVVALGIGYGAGASSNKESAATATKTLSVATTKTARAVAPKASVVTKTVQPVPQKAFGDGHWLVGRDIKSGTYTTVREVQGTCYWERRNPTTNGIIANGQPQGGFPTITLRVGEEFRSMDCGDWRSV